jgi:flagellar protein FliO/FliZ
LGVSLHAWAQDAGVAPGELPQGAEDGGSLFFTLVKTLVVLAVVVGLIYLTLNVGLRKLMGISGVQGRERFFTVLERQPLGPKQNLLLVRAGAEVLLLGQGEGSISLLGKADPAEVDKLQGGPVAAPKVSPFLQKLLGRSGGGQTGQPPPSA